MVEIPILDMILTTPLVAALTKRAIASSGAMSRKISRSMASATLARAR
jgi:hypothetical protein